MRPRIRSTPCQVGVNHAICSITGGSREIATNVPEKRTPIAVSELTRLLLSRGFRSTFRARHTRCTLIYSRLLAFDALLVALLLSLHLFEATRLALRFHTRSFYTRSLLNTLLLRLLLNLDRRRL